VVLGTGVTVTNVETGVQRNAASNEVGYYTISLLIPGKYEVAVLSSPGESHPEALPELYVSVSTHTAPMVINRLRCCSQSASRSG